MDSSVTVVTVSALAVESVEVDEPQLVVEFCTSSGCMSFNLMSWDLETEEERWYSTSSLSELNLTTQRKNLPDVSLNTLKC